MLPFWLEVLLMVPDEVNKNGLAAHIKDILSLDLVSPVAQAGE